MIVTTTDTVPRRKIKEILGVVVTGPVKKFGVRTTSTILRETILEKLADEAKKLGADAIVGVRVATVLPVHVYGTAVKLE